MTLRALSVAALAAMTPVVGRGAVPPISDYAKLPAIVADHCRVTIRTMVGTTLFAIDAGARKLRDVDWRGEGHVLIEGGTTFDDFDRRVEMI